MQGSLRQVALPEVLQFISMGKSSGILHLRNGNTEISLYILNGRIVNSSSIERRRRLGDLLVHRGVLKRSQLAAILQLQRTVESDKRLGTILTERDIVPEKTIRETLRMQLEEEIWSLFAWSEGEFHFEAVEERKLGDAIVQIEIEPLIMEGTRRQDEWQKIQQLLPDENMVLMVAPLPEEFEFSKRLSAAEWKVLSLVNGFFSIRAIINRAGMGRFEVYHILHQLLKAGVLMVKLDRSKKEIEREEGERQSVEVVQPVLSRSEKRGGLLGLLGAKKSSKPDGAGTEAVDFVSPVGALAFFINQMVAEFQGQKEYVPSAEDRRILDTLWRDLVMTYTRSDLLMVERNFVNSRKIEAFFGSCEFGAAVVDCYEDTIEALLQLTEGAYRVFSQRVGERHASKIVRELLAEFTPRIEVRFGGPFKLDERIQGVLRLAA